MDKATIDTARYKDIHCCPSLDCKYHISYDRCNNPDAPCPGHSRCIGSLKCENWEHFTTKTWEMGAGDVTLKLRQVKPCCGGDTDNHYTVDQAIIDDQH